MKHQIIRNICEVSLLFSALYSICPYYAVRYMQSVLIMYCVICKVGQGGSTGPSVAPAAPLRPSLPRRAARKPALLQPGAR